MTSTFSSAGLNKIEIQYKKSISKNYSIYLDRQAISIRLTAYDENKALNDNQDHIQQI